MCILVDLLNPRPAQHRETAGVFGQFLTAEDRLWIGTAFLGCCEFIRPPKNGCAPSGGRWRGLGGGLAVTMRFQMSPASAEADTDWPGRRQGILSG
jgi:hypothetical protein